MIVHISPHCGFNLHLLFLIYISFTTNEIELLFMCLVTTHVSTFTNLLFKYFFPFFFSWMVLILLFKRVLIILVTDLYMCYKCLSLHCLYDFFLVVAGDLNFNMVNVVNLLLDGLVCVDVCVLFRKVPFTLQVHKGSFLCSPLKVNFAFHLRF